MPTVNLAHAKAHLSELLDDLLAGGEKVVITRHGRAVAEVLAVTRPKQPLRPLGAFRAAGPGWRAASADLLREGRDEGL
jgi:antitoxin (DNA-binding transcriptional repressor) of toxin-antitoxin stability system